MRTLRRIRSMAATLRRLAVTGLMAIALVPGTALAGFITQQNLTPIYSANPPFAPANPITVNWAAPQITIFNNALLNINTAAKEIALFALPGTLVLGRIGNGPVQMIRVPAVNPLVDVFFVDTISFCGVAGDNIIGCANAIPGASFAVQSADAAAGSGNILEGHELGHDLGLVHVAGVNTNLMNPVLGTSTTLTAGQATTVLASGLVQGAAPNQFINLQGIAIVPEPATIGLFGLGMGVLAAVRRRRDARRT